MKKILFGISVFLVTLSSAQNYPDYYPSGTNNNSYYGDEEDQFYFPDDYYYDYPSDYYTNDYYQSNYNDYVRSINAVNWNSFFARYRLSPWQIQQIMMLNDHYPSYNAWNSYYRYNPDRWYYDRFYALERIMGPRVFLSFQNRYYQGYSPVIYYQNYRRQHYVTHIYVVPRYRNINVKKYRVDRNTYHQSNPRQSFGFKDSPRNGNGNWQNNSNNSGFRGSENSVRSNGNNGFRDGAVSNSESTPRNQTNGFRNNNTGNRTITPPAKNNNGFRNSNSGVRNPAPQRKIENNSGSERQVNPDTRTSNGSTRKFTSQ